MSVKDCAAFCLIAVPMPDLVRLGAPDPVALPAPSLRLGGPGWALVADGPPPRTFSIG
jgi:hypothetical protein